MRIARAEALAVAQSIARELARTAIAHDGRCTWMGTTQDLAPDGVSPAFRYSTLGADLYGGTAGVGLFLAEAGRVLGDRAARRLSCAAVRHALARAPQLAAEGRYGFYDGVTGIVYAAARVGRLAATPALTAEARALFADAETSRFDAMGLDVIDGAAGAAPALLALSRWLEAPALAAIARHLGNRIIAGARRTDHGWSWPFPMQGGDRLHLTGFSHGTAGIAWALLELHAATGVTAFLEGAWQAIRFEDHWFRAAEDNWPDFRDHAGDPALAPCAHAWCHGAPGIGLARLRASELTGDAALRRDAEAAVRATARWLALADDDADFTPCHGRSGAAEFLLAAGRQLGDAAATRAARRTAAAGARKFGSTPAAWPCGVRRGTNPSLMIGSAGIGYFFLRLAERSVPSVLLLDARTE